MRALQLSKNLSRTLFFTASSSSFPYRTITTATSTSTTALLSSPACHNHIHRRSDTWLSPSLSANLLRSPWSLTQHRGIRVSGSDVKVGNVIEKKGRIYQVVKTDHSHEGRGKATIKVELRDIESGNKVSQRLGTDESVETLKLLISWKCPRSCLAKMQSIYKVVVGALSRGGHWSLESFWSLEPSSRWLVVGFW